MASILQAFHICAHSVDTTSMLTFLEGTMSSSPLTCGVTLLWCTWAWIFGYIFSWSTVCKRSLGCSAVAVHCTYQRRWESCQLALSWLTARGGYQERWGDPWLARFSHKIILVFMTICLWWSLLRETRNAKRKDIKIITKPKTIKNKSKFGKGDAHISSLPRHDS